MNKKPKGTYTIYGSANLGDGVQFTIFKNVAREDLYEMEARAERETDDNVLIYHGYNRPVEAVLERVKGDE
jgi:hypothetical protein